MSEVAMREVLDSLAKIGKQWDLGEPVGRVWGFLLLKSCPVTQREIEDGTGYSRGLISRCLKMLEEKQMIEVGRVGKENRYSIVTSLTEGFGAHLEQVLTNGINPLIELLSRTVDKIEDRKVRENFYTFLHEFKKLNLAVRIFSRILEDINLNALVEDMADRGDYVITIDREDREEHESKKMLLQRRE